MSKFIILPIIILLLSYMILGESIDNTEKDFDSKPNQSESTGLDNQPQTAVKVYFDSMNASSFITKNDTNDVDNITASIQFGSFVLDNYTYKVIKGSQTSFRIGLGIRPNFSNDLIQILKESKYIDKQIVYYSSNPEPSIQFLIDKRKDEEANYTYCGLTERKDLPEKYHNSWVCDFSHIRPKDAELMNETIEINGRAVFDTNSQYIIAPIEYITTIQDYFGLETHCDLFVDDDSDEVDFHCNFTQAEIESLAEISFMFEGIAYAIPGRSLFNETIDDNTNKTYYSSLIVFRKEKKNMWSFGYPFLDHYQMELDFDNKEIGFKGYTTYDMTTQWAEWKNSKVSFINRVYHDKKMMIIGIVLGSAILIFVFVIIIRAFKKRNGGADVVGHDPLHEDNNNQPQPQANKS